MEKLQRQLDEARSLADDFSTFFRGKDMDSLHRQEESEKLPDSSAGHGVQKLEMVTPPKLVYKIRTKKEVSFTVTDSSQTCVYTATTWLNNPSSVSWFGSARTGPSWKRPTPWRMSARLQNATAGTYEIEQNSTTAIISSDGFCKHGKVTSLSPEGPWSSGELLRSDKVIDYQTDLIKPQRYNVSLVLSNIRIVGLDSAGSGSGVGKLRVFGHKDRCSTYYKCFVDATEEVLATYHHTIRGHKHTKFCSC